MVPVPQAREVYNADGSVSPGRFSSSVFNASPGLYSILLGNQASYSALAADGETLESGLLDALLDDSGPRLWLYADETGGGFGVAAFFSDSLPGDPVSLETGVFGGAPLRFEDIRAFLNGECRELSGRNLRLWRSPESEVRSPVGSDRRADRKSEVLSAP